MTLERRLAELISVLERASLPGPEALAASFARVEEALAPLAGLAPEDQERCRRLHALALDLAARRRAELAGQRQALAGLRERIGAARARVSGASCDMDA